MSLLHDLTVAQFVTFVNLTSRWSCWCYRVSLNIIFLQAMNFQWNESIACNCCETQEEGVEMLRADLGQDKCPSRWAQMMSGLCKKPSKAPATIWNNTSGFLDVLFKTVGKPQKASPVGPGVTRGSTALSMDGSIVWESGITDLCSRVLQGQVLYWQRRVRDGKWAKTGLQINGEQSWECREENIQQLQRNLQYEKGLESKRNWGSEKVVGKGIRNRILQSVWREKL